MSNTYPVGSIIKSYDFFGRTDCYMVGMVISQNLEEGTVTCKTVKQVLENKMCADPSDEFTTPVQGNAFMDDEYTRVIVLESQEVIA